MGEFEVAIGACHKAVTAEKLGITDFIDSCPHQAILISARAPQIRTYWWRSGDPVLINASLPASEEIGTCFA